MREPISTSITDISVNVLWPSVPFESSGGTGFSTFPAWETISNAGAYQYIHY